MDVKRGLGGGKGRWGEGEDGWMVGGREWGWGWDWMGSGCVAGREGLGLVGGGLWGGGGGREAWWVVVGYGFGFRVEISDDASPARLCELEGEGNVVGIQVLGSGAGDARGKRMLLCYPRVPMLQVLVYPSSRSRRQGVQAS